MTIAMFGTALAAALGAWSKGSHEGAISSQLPRPIQWVRRRGRGEAAFQPPECHMSASREPSPGGTGRKAGYVGGTTFAIARRVSVLWTARLPRSRTRAIWVVALFAVVQLADGALTLAGIQRFGPSAEGNPILAFYMTACGVVATVVAAKCLTVVLAVALHARACYLALAALTVLYVLGAIAPWATLIPLT